MKAIQAIFSAAVAALTLYLGNILVPLTVLVVLMTLDWISGLVKAWTNSELSSKIGAKGILKKVGYLIVIVVAMVCDYLISAGLTTVGVEIAMPAFICILVTVWFICNECISILENLGEIGVPLPGFLMKLIKRLKTSVEKKGEPKEEESPSLSDMEDDLK